MICHDPTQKGCYEAITNNSHKDIHAKLQRKVIIVSELI